MIFLCKVKLLKILVSKSSVVKCVNEMSHKVSKCFTQRQRTMGILSGYSETCGLFIVIYIYIYIYFLYILGEFCTYSIRRSSVISADWLHFFHWLKKQLKDKLSSAKQSPLPHTCMPVIC